MRDDKGCVCPPDEVPAVGAVGGLPQVGGHELVSVDLVDPPADGALTLPGTHPLPKHSLLILRGARGSCRDTNFKISKYILTVFFNPGAGCLCLFFKICSHITWPLDGADTVRLRTRLWIHSVIN